MRDSTLFKIALFGSVIGLIILYVGTLAFEPVQVEIIGEEDIGKLVQITGEIQQIREFESSFLIQVSGFTVFSNKAITPDIEVGDFIQIIGQVQEYKGELEVIPRRQGDLIVL